MNKKCSKCNEIKHSSYFFSNPSQKDGFDNLCKVCRREFQKVYQKIWLKTPRGILYLKNPDTKDRCKKYYKQNKKYMGEYHKKKADNLRKDILFHYSNGIMKCALCGYDNVLALCIDHINGGGLKQRRELKITGGTQFFRWLKKNNYPKGYRVLCMNCNWLERRTVSVVDKLA